MDRFSYRGDIVKVRRHDVVDVSGSLLTWKTVGMSMPTQKPFWSVVNRPSKMNGCELELDFVVRFFESQVMRRQRQRQEAPEKIFGRAYGCLASNMNSKVFRMW